MPANADALVLNKVERADYRKALDEAATARAREFAHQVATAPRWDGDGSDVWF